MQRAVTSRSVYSLSDFARTVKTLEYLYGFFAIALTIVTALPASNNRAWWVRTHDFPRVQYAFLLVGLIITLWVWPESAQAPSRLWTLLLVAALAYQLYWIWPYTRLHKVEVPSIDDANGYPRLRLLTSNVLMHNRDAPALISAVRTHTPDIVITLESDHWWQEQLDNALTEWPHRVACPLDNLYGMHLYSRLPLRDAHVDFLVDEDIPSIVARVEIGEPPVSVRLHAIHPTPPAPGENLRSTERDVELLMLADSVADESGPVIVTGDLNDVAWSRTTRLFCNISGLLDPRIGRGLINTFHTNYRFLRWPLDHFFVSDHVRLLALRRLPSIGSDHFPMLIEIAVGPSRAVDAKTRSAGIDRELEQDTRDTDVAATAVTPSEV